MQFTGFMCPACRKPVAVIEYEKFEGGGARARPTPLACPRRAASLARPSGEDGQQ